MKLPNFVNPSTDSLPTIGHDLSNKEVKNESYQELHSLNKKGAAKSVFFIEKQIRKIQMVLDIENSLWKSDFDTFDDQSVDEFKI